MLTFSESNICPVWRRQTGLATNSEVHVTAKVKKTKAEVALERRGNGKSNERRNSDRRAADQPVAVERRQLERREKVNRRRQIDPTTCERDYSVEEVEFMNALDEYKRKNGRMFPTCSEILEVIRGLGYARPGASETIKTG
jgi:hypothetical protein